MNFSDLTNFSSPSFLMFLSIGVTIFHLVPGKFRQIVLLLLSYVFYASFKFEYLAILIFTTCIDFYSSHAICERKKNNKGYFPLLLLCIFTNLGLLVYFKYAHMILNLFQDYKFEKIIFPLDLSFFTLQSIGYVLDVSRNRIQPEKNFVTYALFVSFFPQIIAGPIERASDILPQYKERFRFRNIQWEKTIYLFTYGFFKKFIVADNLAMVTENIQIHSSSPLLVKYLTLVYFFLRIYCDFSGYTDMARGIALLFGVQLTENFRFPLFAESPSDFWKRWHISLGRWINNYFYLPLLSILRNPYFALVIIFIVMELWHGPHVKFVYWGLIWGIVGVLVKLIPLPHPGRILSTILTFNLAVILAAFNKSESLQVVGEHLSLHMNFFSDSSDLHLLRSCALLPVSVILYELYLFKYDDYCLILSRNVYVKVAFYTTIGFMSLFFLGVATQQIFYLQY